MPPAGPLLEKAKDGGIHELTDIMQCEVCGNEYDKPLEISVQGQSHVFDSFECAIQALAPKCAHCGCRVIGHGVEEEGKVYCCSSCASRSHAHSTA